MKSNFIGNVVYIGDFDCTNENVQWHFVSNNAKILNRLGYNVVFFGINRHIFDCSYQQKKRLADGNIYIELPNTLNLKGFFYRKSIYRLIENTLNKQKNKGLLKYVFSYQSPLFLLFYY